MKNLFRSLKTLSYGEVLLSFLIVSVFLVGTMCYQSNEDDTNSDDSKDVAESIESIKTEEIPKIIKVLEIQRPEYCRNYTEEQLELIQRAYDFGKVYDYGFTLAAITIKESFVGNRVLRINPNDPSFGITHIHFGTIKHLGKLTHYEAIRESERLILDDELSWSYSVKKLDSIKGTFYNKWRRYNGSGKKAEKYASSIQSLIKEMKECYSINTSQINEVAYEY